MSSATRLQNAFYALHMNPYRSVIEALTDRKFESIVDDLREEGWTTLRLLTVWGNAYEEFLGDPPAWLIPPTLELLRMALSSAPRRHPGDDALIEKIERAIEAAQSLARRR